MLLKLHTSEHPPRLWVFGHGRQWMRKHTATAVALSQGQVSLWECGGGQKHFKQPAAQMVLQDTTTSLIAQLLSKCRGKGREGFHPIYGCSMVKASRCSSQEAPWKSPHHNNSVSSSNSKRWGKHLFSKTPFENNSKLFMHKEQRAQMQGRNTCTACTGTQKTYLYQAHQFPSTPSHLVASKLEKTMNSPSDFSILFNSKILYVKYTWNTTL